MKRILLSIFTCLFLAISYQILIWGGIIPPSDGIHIWQSNAIKAQRYVYNNNPEPNLVLVGSSLTDLIREDYMGDSVQNLAFAGDASQTGVEIVKRKKSKPPILAVEMSSTISRGVNEELIDFLYQPLLYWLKLYFPIFREEYRPVSVVVNWIKNIAKHQRQVAEPVTEKEKIPNPDLRKRLV